jgi:hypothetical protein
VLNGWAGLGCLCSLRLLLTSFFPCEYNIMLVNDDYIFAADTLPSYPFQDTDPFVIQPSKLPHIYFAGNQVRPLLMHSYIHCVSEFSQCLLRLLGYIRIQIDDFDIWPPNTPCQHTQVFYYQVSMKH